MPFINITKRLAVKKNIYGICGRQKKLKSEACKTPIKPLSGRDYGLRTLE